MCIADWATETGLNPSTISARLDRGWSSADALSVVPRDTSEWELTAHGQTKNLVEWSRVCGIPVSTLKHRLEINWSVEDAISTPPGAKGVGRKRTVLLTVNGVEKEIQVWADEVGIGRTTIEERIKRGWSHEDAVLRPRGWRKTS